MQNQDFDHTAYTADQTDSVLNQASFELLSHYPPNVKPNLTDFEILRLHSRAKQAFRHEAF